MIICDPVSKNPTSLRNSDFEKIMYHRNTLGKKCVLQKRDPPSKNPPF